MSKKTIAGKICNEHGSSIVEVTVALLLLSIMIAGLSQLMISQRHNVPNLLKDVMALQSGSNQVERLICQVKDGSWGTTCPSTPVQSDAAGVTSTPPMSSDFRDDDNSTDTEICPKCQIDWRVSCVDPGVSTNKWRLEVWTRDYADAANPQTMVYLTRDVFHE